MIFNDNLAKVAEQYLKKGMKVYVEGQLQTRKWQDQTGDDRYTTEIVLQKFRGELQMLDARGQGGERRSLFRRRPAVRISASQGRAMTRVVAVAAAALAVAAAEAGACRANSTTRYRSEGTS